MGCTATKCCATTSPCGETLVFADKNYDFRIPALLYVKEWNTFLAFAEKRTSSNDADATNLVMSKGTRQPDDSLQWSSREDLMKATKDGYRTMNPCPVFERISKTLFLFFICIEGNTPEGKLKPGQTCLCYVTSTDCGETWSGLTDLTSSVNFTNYQTFAVGPGHGIQLSSGPLLVPAYVKVYSGKSVKPHSVVLHSEDLNTWKAVQPIGVESGECHTWKVGQPIGVESGECQLAEVSDGGGRRQVYLNARSTGAPVPRVEALSDNGGASFTLFPLKNRTLKETPHGCQGSVLGFPASDIPAGGGGSSETELPAGGGGSSETELPAGGGGSSETELPAGGGGSSETALLFSHPTKGKGWDRLDLGVYLRKSLQDDDPWGKPHIIHKGASGYSDLTCCEEEGHFGCLMECGKGEVSKRLQIAFREFDLK